MKQKILLGFIVLILIGMYLIGNISTEEPPILSENASKPIVTRTPTPRPTARALRAATGLYILASENEKNTLIQRFAPATGDPAEALESAALVLDQNEEKLLQAEAFISTSNLPLENNETTLNEPQTPEYSDSDTTGDKSLRYNPYNGSWDYASQDETLKYNVFEDRYEYVTEDESVRYNALGDRWEFAADDERVKYNAFEDTWHYAEEDSVTKYNAMEDTWEITDEDSTLRYNAMEDTWSYE